MATGDQAGDPGQRDRVRGRPAVFGESVRRIGGWLSGYPYGAAYSK
jgi:hypothetical protein